MANWFLKGVVSFLGYTAAAFGKSARNWSGYSSNSTHLTSQNNTFFNEIDPNPYNFFPINPPKIVKFKGSFTDFIDFREDEIFHFEEQYQANDLVVTEVIASLKSGCLLKMPASITLSITHIGDSIIQIESPKEKEKIILIEYTKGDLNFFTARYRHENQIRLERNYSYPANDNNVKHLVEQIMNISRNRKNDIPHNLEMLNPESGLIKEIPYNILLKKEYGNGQFSLNDLKKIAAETSPDLPSVLTKLNKLIKQITNEVADNPDKAKIIAELRTNIVKFAHVRNDKDIRKIGKELKKFITAKFLNNLEPKPGMSNESINYIKDFLIAIVNKLLNPSLIETEQNFINPFSM